MPFSKAGQLARTVSTARLSDPIGLVAENLRESPHGVLPVLDRVTVGDQNDKNARVIGLITQRDLSKATQNLMSPSVPLLDIRTSLPPRPLASETTPSVNIEKSPFGASTETVATEHLNGSSPNVISPNDGSSFGVDTNQNPSSGASTPKTQTAGDVMRGDVPIIPAVFSLHNALLTLERYDFPALPVIDEAGRYIGLISRADVVSAISGTIRPPVVGGMASPLGVYLTDGRLSGGVSLFGLFLSGFTLAGCLAFSQVVLALLASLVNPEWGAMALSGRISALSGNGGDLVSSIATLVQGVAFLLAMRMLPISGYHAAEHQTVHAIERGLPLEIEYVEKMPRAHPRCGTNLTVIAGLITIGCQHLPELSAEFILLLLVITFFFWRSLGTTVQEVFTTRPATKKQLQSGIDAAKELMRKYQDQPFASPAAPLRLLNNGMVPVAAGMMLGLFTLLPGIEYLARLILR